jgi:hypothetical protein
MLREQTDDRHHEARGAEAALQAVAFVKRLLHGMKWSVVSGQALDRRHFVAFRLDGEHQAGAHRRTVEQNGAAPAHAVLAADVRAGQAEVVAQVVGQEAARIRRRWMRGAVDLHAANAFSVSTRTR